MFERIRHAVGIISRLASVPARRRRTEVTAFTSPPEFLESRQLLTPQLVSSVEGAADGGKAAKKATAPNIVGTWELAGSGFVGYLIISTQNGNKVTATLTANANFTLPEINFNGNLRGTKLSAPKFHHQAIPAGVFTGKLKVELDSATALHGSIRGKNNGAAYNFAFTGIHISDQ